MIVFVLAVSRGGFGPGPADFSIDLSSGYKSHRTSAHQIMIAPENGWNSETPIIPTKVVELAWDSNFVIAKQQHLKRRNHNNPSDLYEEPVPNQYSYWILNVENPAVFGPFNESTFNAKRIEYNLDPKLSLKDVCSYCH